MTFLECIVLFSDGLAIREEEEYNPEFDSGILKDAEISASLTIL